MQLLYESFLNRLKRHGMSVFIQERNRMAADSVIKSFLIRVLKCGMSAICIEKIFRSVAAIIAAP